jgi:hypothetical protein
MLLVFDGILDGTTHIESLGKHHHIPTGAGPIRSSHDERVTEDLHTHTECI